MPESTDEDNADLQSDSLPAQQEEMPSGEPQGSGAIPAALQRLGAQSVRAWRSLLTDQVTPVRLASHVALLMVAGLVLLFAQIDFPRWEVVRSEPASPDRVERQPAPALVQAPVGGSLLEESGALLRAPVPFTEIPDRPRLEVVSYTVQIDDTVLGIARQFGLNPNTVVWSNHDDLSKPFVMAVGQMLDIPPVDGVLHTVEDGDTVEAVATEYDTEPEKIVAWAPNQVAAINSPLTAGQILVVPGGDRTLPEPPASQGPLAPWRAQDFVWPAYGRLTQVFWLPAHPAIDIGSPLGTPVRAADAGRVVVTVWSSEGYGNHVVISHPDGYRTLYAHLDSINISVGENVARAELIGTVGSTGRSTGPHLHFEVSFSGRRYNPMLYLP
ncbi:MAG: M23 family metallopeptidase [Chloroflexota bacterium]|nr:M23 family metallopeptidase [Chloroflexota bacterium]